MKYIFGLLAVAVIGAGAFFYFTTSSSDTPDDTERERIVYETEVDTADDCAPMETFDAERNMCIFECEDEAACNEYENYIDQEFSSLSDEATDDTSPIKEKAIADNADAEATYTVSGDEAITLASGTANTEHQEIWKKIAALAPDDFSARYIEQYQVFRNPTDDTLAFVSDDDGNGKWTVAVNASGYEDSNDRERAVTIIHELGHIVTLNQSQVTPNVATCSGFDTGSEGCAGTGSYLAGFVSKFWTDSELKTVGGGAGEGNTELFAATPEKFVTEYAATNPTEDIAESFALFILDPKKDAQSVSEQKVQYFYNFPDLVTFRDQMRSAITKGIVRARKTTDN